MNDSPVLSHILDAIRYGSPVWDEYVSFPDGMTSPSYHLGPMRPSTISPRTI